MIVINKKRIQIIVTCLLIAIFAFVFQMGNNKNVLEENINTKQEQEKTIATTATPVSGKTIVIDAGHGVPDERSTK